MEVVVDDGDEHEQQLKMKEQPGEALNNDDVDIEDNIKNNDEDHRCTDQRGNHAKVDPKVNSPVTQS